MGEATRTTKLLLDLGQRSQGGAKSGRREHFIQQIRATVATTQSHICCTICIGRNAALHTP